MEIVKEEKETAYEHINKPQEVEQTLESPKEQIKYDSQKQYEWKQSDVFYMTGAEFGVILNALRGVLGTREAQTILLAERASEHVEGILARAVEAGIGKEKIK